MMKRNNSGFGPLCMLVFLLVWIVALIVYQVNSAIECHAAGGVRVRAAFGYECVKVAR